MPTERIPDQTFDDWAAKICTNREHDPPAHKVFKPGAYKHTCPQCGNVQYFRVPAVMWSHEVKA